MAIYTYNKHNPHPNNSPRPMIRVSVMINGIQRQAYFDPSDRKDAVAIEAKWLKEKEREMSKRRRRKAPGVRHTDLNELTRTGVAGIRMLIKLPYGRERSYSPQLALNSRNKSRPGVYATARITDQKSLDTAWRNQTAKLARAEGYKTVPKSWRKLSPKVTRFKELARHYRREGHNIPKGFI